MTNYINDLSFDGSMARNSHNAEHVGGGLCPGAAADACTCATSLMRADANLGLCQTDGSRSQRAKLPRELAFVNNVQVFAKTCVQPCQTLIHLYSTYASTFFLIASDIMLH